MITNNCDGFVPSVLDRLVDASLALDGPLWYDEPALARSVQRDIENLLNARQSLDGLQAFPQLRESMLSFGLPDATAFNWESPSSRLLFVRTIEAVIRQHEPRVDHVRVTLLDSPKPQRNQLHFRIDAKLRAEQAPNVTFETTLRLGSGHFETSDSIGNGNRP